MPRQPEARTIATRKRWVFFLGALTMASGFAARTALARRPKAFIERFGWLTPVASTVSGKDDVNPRGVALVPQSIGALTRDHVLVSNFVNSHRQPGTGTTIMDIAPDGTARLFAQIVSAAPFECPGGIGLTAALTVLRAGWVIVGSLPTADGTAQTAQPGCLLILDSHGKLVETIHGGLINGPWGMTAFEEDNSVILFVANVLDGTVAAGGATVNQGTVVRLRLVFQEEQPPTLVWETEIGSGFAERTDADALVMGPSGLALSDDGTLYVADTDSNRIATISIALIRQLSAGAGETVSAGGALNRPAGLAIAPNGHLIVVNAGDGNMIEIRPDGKQLAVVDSGFGAGSLSGLAMAPGHTGVYLANQDDNTLQLLH